MSSLSIQPAYPLFTDSDGSPLDDGFIWIGTAGSGDPINNPQTAYWDAALTQAVTQPVRTRGGYPLNAGAIGRMYVAGDYSISVANRNGSVMYGATNAVWSNTGDVSGPASAVSGNIVTFDGATGKLIQNGGKALPSGSVVGTTDTQTLTNKTITENVQIISTNTNAVPSTVYVMTASLTLTLPSTPNAGDNVSFANFSNTLTCVIDRNGSNIMALAEDMTVDGLTYFATLVYADATRGWVLQ